jgi:deoxyguanosine kinase
MSNPQHVFFVEGNIGSGKTSFLQQLEAHYPELVQVIYEPVAQWEQTLDRHGKNILDYFYGDMARYSYLFQSAVFLSRVRALEGLDPSKRFVFIERSVDCDIRIFASNCLECGTMSDIEWTVYADWHQWMCAKLKETRSMPPPSACTYVYLRTAPAVAFGRMQARNRASESAKVEAEYIEKLHLRHEAWLNPDDATCFAAGRCAENVVVLDGDQRFIDDETVLASMMRQCLAVAAALCKDDEHREEEGAL